MEEKLSENGTPAGGLAVEAKGLTKRYGRRVVAVDELDLSIERGETYGLLGPNGAGKTTTLRMLVGLVRPTSGGVWVLGFAPGDPEGLARLGAMIETPSFYPFLSGRDNLRVIARRVGAMNRRVEEVLDLTSLAPRAKDAFGKYSLGMKQRLGVAATLLKDPELLILDEPSNGLDPIGQLEMRRLIRDLGEGGRTVILSSHDLSEVERLCDRVGVIGGGRMLAEGTVEELRGKPGLLLRAEPLQEAVYVAGKLAGVSGVVVEDGRIRLSADPLRAAEVNRKLVGGGFDVSELGQARRPFEEVFLDLTGGRTAGADSLRGSRETDGDVPGERERGD